MRDLFVLFTTVLVLVAGSSKHEPLSDELIDYINSRPSATWKAAKSLRFQHLDQAVSMLGTMREDPRLKELRRPTITYGGPELGIPEEFDARKQWPKCKTIQQIRDQSSCGSCWAFGAVTAMSDRVCIHSGQNKTNVQLSATDLLACCTDCGFGCAGGWVGVTWDYWKKSGIVTGGEYGDSTTCLPYPFEPCAHHGAKGTKYKPCPKPLYPTPACASKCQKGYQKGYEQDKIYAFKSYNVRGEKDIQREIYENGPVEAAMNVYADFLNYEQGVYQHTTGDLLGGHAIRLLGWGVDEKGTPYWLAANSWNPTWGEEGYFRILRGSDHCGIESDVAAGIPRL